jgi:hypothetical protein
MLVWPTKLTFTSQALSSVEKNIKHWYGVSGKELVEHRKQMDPAR